MQQRVDFQTDGFHFCPDCQKPLQPPSHSCSCSSHDRSLPSAQHHDGIRTCQHPVIFDKRFIIEEHPLHHNHFDHHDDCSCGRICLCDNRFRIRLAGLQGGMAFRLRQLIDCDVKLEIEQGEGTTSVSARICMVGSDFVEVQRVIKPKIIKRTVRGRTKKRKCVPEKVEFRVIPFDSIKSLTFKETPCC